MSVSYLASGAGASTSGTSVNAGIPASAVAGDLAVAVVHSVDAIPAGWQHIDGDFFAEGVKCAACYKPIVAGEPGATAQFTRVSGSASVFLAARIAVFRSDAGAYEVGQPSPFFVRQHTHWPSSPRTFTGFEFDGDGIAVALMADQQGWFGSLSGIAGYTKRWEYASNGRYGIALHTQAVAAGNACNGGTYSATNIGSDTHQMLAALGDPVAIAKPPGLPPGDAFGIGLVGRP